VISNREILIESFRIIKITETHNIKRKGRYQSSLLGFCHAFKHELSCKILLKSKIIEKTKIRRI